LEANFVGYTTTGSLTVQNDLYRTGENGRLAADQSRTILGEYLRFSSNPAEYSGSASPDCTGIRFQELWQAHSSHRLDPKYFLFKREERTAIPHGWVRCTLRDIMSRREQEVHPEQSPDQAVRVMTISQTGEIRPREAGKGRNPPEWLGVYFEDSPSQWFVARENDVVFSSIDLWKGCIAVVPREFDGALVTKEFPVYEINDERLDPEFISALLRSRYYQRAFRAITTGHSNRRRTQREDFEELEICFPLERSEQLRLISSISAARTAQRAGAQQMKDAFLEFSNLIDGRGAEELPEVDGNAVDSTSE
jgi:type I restriction enzyme M protein